MKTSNRVKKSEKGQALIIVLGFLVLGTLTIATLLSLLSTGLSAGQRYEENVKLRYATDAGMEDALWKMKNEQLPFGPGDYGASTNYTLSDHVNGKIIAVNMTQLWPLTGFESDAHGTNMTGSLTITGGVVNLGEGKYKIQISYDGNHGALPIDKVAVWLPTRFQYVSGSSSGITTQNPTITNQRGGRVLTWNFSPPVNFLDLPNPAPPGGGFLPGAEYPATRKLYFNITPHNDAAGGSFTWVRTTDTDLYLAWETGCSIVQISSTATDNITGKSITLRGATYSSQGASLGEGGIQIRGDYRAVGNTLMRNTNPDVPRVRNTLDTQSSANITNIPADGEVVLAYLYWSGWRDYESVGVKEADRFVGLRVNNQMVYFDESGNPVQGEPPGDNATGIFRPNYSGDYNETSRSPGSSSRYTYVDEVIADGSSTYVYASGGGTKMDTYNIPNLGVVTTIYSVTVHARARASDTGNMRMQIVARTHSTNYFGDMITLIGNAGWSNYSQTWTTNPNTGQPWTYTEVDDLQIGIKLYDDGTGQPQCTQVYAGVDYHVPYQGIEASRYWLLDNVPPDYSYSCFRDVTELVKLISPQGNATYTVIGVTGNTTGEWSYAGWSLMVFYASPSELPHQLFLYDTFLFAGTNTSHSFTIEGFETPADATAVLTCFVGEGDPWYGGTEGTADYLQFNSFYLSDNISPMYNVWNGQSSGLGGLVIDGVDIDTFNVSNPIIEPGDTSALVQLGTHPDNWNLIYVLLSFRTQFGGLTPNATGIISYSYGGP